MNHTAQEEEKMKLEQLLGGDGESEENQDNKKEVETEKEEGEDENPPSFENVLDELGMPGRFQLVQIALSLAALVVCSFMGLSVVFLGHTPDHECRKVNETQLLHDFRLQNDSNVFVRYRSCDLELYTKGGGSNNTKMEKLHSLTCPNGREFLGVEDTTYVSEWDLVCEAKGKAGVSHTVFTVGQIVGGVFASFVADRFGRKPVMVTASFLSCLVEALCILSPSISVVYVFRFMEGLCYMAVVNSSIIFAMELVAPRHRQVYGVTMSLLWVISVLVVAMVAYVLRHHNWRYFYATAAATGLVFLLLPFFLKESPRWLSANNRTEEALDILRIASKQNGKDFEVVREKYNAFIAHTFGKFESQESQSKREEEEDTGVTRTNLLTSIKTKISNSSLLAAMRNKTILSRMAIAWFIWLTNILTYFGLFISSSTLAGDRFLNFVLMDLVEIPSTVLLLFMLNRMGRRVVLVSFMVTTSLALMVSALLLTFGRHLPGADTTTTALFILGKFAISSSFGVVYIMTPELFPTNIRSTATGACNALGRLGSSVAPFLNPLRDVAEWGPALLLTLMCLVAILLVGLLPETKDLDLPNTVEELMQQQLQQKNKKKGKKRDDGRGSSTTV